MADLTTEILQANKRIRGYIRHTPLEFSSSLSNLEKDCNVYIKLESEQLTGSFKVRGAFNKVLKLKQIKHTVGHYTSVVTASSGNHGIGCLAACKEVGMSLTVFCRLGVDESKKSMLEQGGATVRLHGEDGVEAELEARRYSTETGVPFISPYNDLDVVAGQGTIGVEIIEDLPSVDVVLVPVGGGGLIGGIARYIKQVKPSVKIIGCQPEKSKVMYESIKADKIVFEESHETLSDATSGGLEDNSVTFQLCKDYVDEWITVTEDQIGRAIVFMVQNHHKIVEGSAGVSLGAFMNNSARFKGQNVVIISCGANISPLILRKLLFQHLPDK